MDFHLSYQWDILNIILPEIILSDTDENLLQWWNIRNAPDFGDEKKSEQLFLEQIYNLKNNISLDACIFYHSYLHHFLEIDLDKIPEDKKLEYAKKYPTPISTRDLKDKFPEIYNKGYTEKILINDTKIIKLKLKLLNNTMSLVNEDGYTLNQIADLVKKYFILTFNFNDYYLRTAKITMDFTFKDNFLKVDIGCDI
jgi:hypothetical protein